MSKNARCVSALATLSLLGIMGCAPKGPVHLIVVEPERGRSVVLREPVLPPPTNPFDCAVADDADLDPGDAMAIDDSRRGARLLSHASTRARFGLAVMPDTFPDFLAKAHGSEKGPVDLTLSAKGCETTQSSPTGIVAYEWVTGGGSGPRWEEIARTTALGDTTITFRVDELRSRFALGTF